MATYLTCSEGPGTTQDTAEIDTAFGSEFCT